MKKKNTGTYQIFDRLFYLMKCDLVIQNDYIKKFETSRSSFFRDIEYLRNFYDIDFVYDRFNNLYRKIKQGAENGN